LSVFVGWLALTNDRRLVIYCITLSRENATFFYWVLSIFGIVASVYEMGQLLYCASLRQRIVLSAEGLFVPESAYSSTEKLIPYQSIIEIKTFDDSNPSWFSGYDRGVVIRHRSGDDKLKLDMFADESTFLELLQELKSRIERARKPPEEIEFGQNQSFGTRSRATGSTSFDLPKLDDYSSGKTPRPCTHDTPSEPEFPPSNDPGKRSKRGRRIPRLALLLILGVAIAGPIFYFLYSDKRKPIQTTDRVNSDKGELVLTSEKDGVDVVTTQGGRLVEIVATKKDKPASRALPSGVYELTLQGNPKDLKLGIDKATITRGKQTLANIEQLTPSAPLPSSPPFRGGLWSPGPLGCRMAAWTNRGCQDHLKRLAELEARVAELTRKLEEATRAGKRQAAPFRKGPPTTDPKKQGRKSGDAHGTHVHWPSPPPDEVAECHHATLSEACPHCRGPMIETDTAAQFQTEIPRTPLISQFTVYIGCCSSCGRRTVRPAPIDDF
jgi:rRNA maturation protein Nop10